jgi:hypothetical protein
MDNETLMSIAVVAVAALVAVGLWVAMRSRRTRALRAQFGPEYDHVLQSKTAAEAERELEQRKRRVESFRLKALAGEDAERFGASWRRVQARFVDDPPSAVIDADHLIDEVMRARGYLLDDPARRLEDLSVEHAHVVNHYRAGREIVARHERNEASTEDLRYAMVHFRELFE